MKTANNTQITPVADSGDSLETLRALRHKLAETIDKSESGRDIAALSRQLQMVMAQIAEQEALQSEDDPVQDLLKEKKYQQVRGRDRHAFYEGIDEVD